MRRALALCAALLWASGSTQAANDNALRAGAFDPPRLAPELALPGTHGKALSLADYRGKVIVIGFGFTTCTEVCPVTLATLAKARKALGAQAKDIQVLYVTVDPERDNAEKLRQYLAVFDPTFVGGTGSASQLAKVRQAYGVSAEKKASGNSYFIAHSSFTYLVDRQGRLRALMPFGHTADDYAHDLKLLLKE